MLTWWLLLLHLSLVASAHAAATCNRGSGDACSPASKQPANGSGELTVADMNQMYLEYYKYLILTQLKITADPDKLEPQVSSETKAIIDSTIEAHKETAANQTAALDAMARQKRNANICDDKFDPKSPNTCCLEPLYVNFTSIGWDKWVLYPDGFYANYCRGRCGPIQSDYYHSTILHQFNILIGLCCAPKVLKPLRMLYITEDNKVVSSSVHGMFAESCGCF